MGLPDICVGQQKGTDGSIWTPTGQPTEQDLSCHPLDVSAKETAVERGPAPRTSVPEGT